MMNRMNCLALVLLYFWCVIASEAAPAKIVCLLGDGLLNSLVGKGVQDTNENAAEEDVLGWLGGSPDAVAQLFFTDSNRTSQQLDDCLKEYGKTALEVTTKPLPPGVPYDPSGQQYIPFTSGKDEAVGSNGEYYTTYDGSHYRFKEKGYVIDMLEDASGTSTTPPVSSTTQNSTRKPLDKRKNELKLWYNAFVSVVSKYV